MSEVHPRHSIFCLSALIYIFLHVKIEMFINKLNLVKIRLTNMVQALVKIDENTNRVLNIVRAKYGLKDKGRAIELVVKRYIEEEDEPELRPDFIKKIKLIEKQNSIRIDNFSKRYGLK